MWRSSTEKFGAKPSQEWDLTDQEDLFNITMSWIEVLCSYELLSIKWFFRFLQELLLCPVYPHETVH